MYLSDKLIEEAQKVISSLVETCNLRYSKPLSVAEASAATELGSQNILGFGLGEKIVGSRPQGRPAIRGYVVRKAPVGEVAKDYLIRTLADQYIAGHPSLVSDVVEVGRPTLLHHRSRQYDPRVPAGVAIANDRGTPPGTLGVWLTDGHVAYLLTCWHCIDGGSGAGATVNVEQPRGGKVIATLFASIAPAACPPGSVTIDAAIARAQAMSDTENFILQIGEVRGTKTVTSTYYPVSKSGAITHRTDGGIVDVKGSMILTIPSWPQAGGTVFYEQQLLIQPNPSQGPFAAAGDSGSLVVSSDHYAVGLLVGGTQLPPLYVATPIEVVLNELARVGKLSRLTIAAYP